MTTETNLTSHVITKLQEIERLTGQGLTLPEAAKRVGITDQIFFSWWREHWSHERDEVTRLQAVEQENARLMRIIAEQALDISMLKAVVAGNSKSSSATWESDPVAGLRRSVVNNSP